MSSVAERIRVEIRFFKFKHVGRLSVDYKEIASSFSNSKFGDILEKVDKRLYHHYIDGVTIFDLTPRQYSKFQKIFNSNNNPS